MSNNDQFRAPAGWYPDPLGLPQLRWWNNQGWTEQVSAAPEPIRVAEAQFAWKEDEPPVAPAAAPAAHREPPPAPPVATTTLHQLEAPQSAAQVQEPSTYTKYTQPGWAGTAGSAIPAVAPSASNPPMPVPPAPTVHATAVQPAATGSPTPPPYWDEDDQSLPEPSVRPEDLKFWPGTSPAELRRQAREKAAREANGT